MVHRSLKVLNPFYVWHLRVSTGTDRRDDAFKVTIGRVIDDPAALAVFIYLFDPRFEFGPRVESIFLPDAPDLAEDLLPVRIPSVPLN